MSARAFRLQGDDNVATLLDDAPAGPVLLLGHGGTSADLVALEPIARGHKIALTPVSPGEPIVKFGARIGHCTRPIARGAWVHLHNLASDLDERSATLDLRSGVANDHASAYE